MKQLTSCLFIVLILVVGGWIYLNMQFEKDFNNPYGTKLFAITEGQGVGEIVDSLKEEGFLESALLFKVYVALKDVQSKFKPGEYALDTGMSIKELVTELTKDKPAKKEVKVTFLEGWNMYQMADKVAELGLFSSADFLTEVTDNANNYDYAFLSDKPRDASLEGYLYPDTYLLFTDATPADLVTKMLNNFDRKLQNEVRRDITSQGRDIFEVLTMASIVEKEMFGYENRRIVADIFWSRIDVGMRLQSDATVNYFTKKGNTRPSLDELDIENPYNTYRNDGLPPGPIGNPSIESIKATTYPAETNYLFFLTTPENDIIYSRNLDEHIINRNKYLD